MQLISVAQDPKTIKGEKLGVFTGIQFGAPAKEAGVGNMCPFASKGCLGGCLYTAGYGKFDVIKQARKNRTVLFMLDRAGYWKKLIPELKSLLKRAAKQNMIAAARLNGTTDTKWEKTPVVIDGVKLADNIMELFPAIMFYDYTKFPYAKRPNLPDNYDLTFSRSESNGAEVVNNLRNGRRVAVVFNTKPNAPLPESWTADDGSVWPVVSGDDSDVRFYDARGVVVGLHAKGEARKDTSGFVVQA